MVQIADELRSCELRNGRQGLMGSAFAWDNVEAAAVRKTELAK